MITTNRAGRRRLARRAQNALRAIPPVDRCSLISSVVIRKPESTKNVSRAKKPPGMKDSPPWYAITARTPTARTPSNAGMYPSWRGLGD